MIFPIQNSAHFELSDYCLVGLPLNGRVNAEDPAGENSLSSGIVGWDIWYVSRLFLMKNTLLKNPQIISSMITVTITLFSLPRANRLHKTWPTIHGCDQTTPVFDRTLSVVRPLFHVLSVQTLSGTCCHFMANEISNHREKIRLTVLRRLTVLKHFNVYLYLLRSCSLGYITRRINEEK